MARPILTYHAGGGVTRSVTGPALQSTPGPGVEDGGTPILNYLPDGGPAIPSWPPTPSDLTYPECGIIQLVSGQNYIEVTFTNEKPDVEWIFEDLQIVNTTDPTPLNIWPGVVTEKSITGFRLELNGSPITDNYFLHWAVGGCATSDWVVSGGTTATNFLQLTDTPDEYVGQAGMGVKVNAGEDGLEFGVVSSSGGGVSGPVFNVLDYGAVADCQTLLDITMPNGAVVTSAAYEFTEADVGKTAIIRGATAGGISPMIGTIISVSGNSATLDTATTSALTAVEASSYPRMDFGTDNTVAFVLCCLAVPGPGQRNFDDSIPFEAIGVMNPILAGDGGVVYIPRGNYLLNQIATFPFWFFEANNIYIKGDGMGATVLFYDSWSTDGLLGGSFADHGLFQNVTLSDFTMWDLNYNNGAPANTINMQGIDNLRIERVETVNGKGNGCINVQGYGGAVTPLNNRVQIRDCWIHGNEEDGNTTLFAYGIEGDGMNVGQVRDVQIISNTIEGPARHGYEGGGYCLDQYFVGNTVDMKDIGLSGLNPTGGSTTAITGNTIRNVVNGYGIDVTVDVGSFTAKDVRVMGNYVSGSLVNPGPQALIRFQNTSLDTSTTHVDRIIMANNWVESVYSGCSGVLLGDASMSIMINNNWFNVLQYAIAGGPFTAATGKYIIAKDNFFGGNSGFMPQMSTGNIILEGNIIQNPVAWYGSGAATCSIDSQTVTAGSIYSNTNSSGAGFRVTDNVEIVRGTTTAPELIIWAVVTAANVVTTYAYNPTGTSKSTGTGCQFIVHRPIAP